MYEGDLFDEETGERIGPATPEQVEVALRWRSAGMYLKPDGTLVAYSSVTPGAWPRVRVETRLTAAERNRVDAEAAAYAAAKAKDARSERHTVFAVNAVAVWFAIAMAAAVLVGVVAMVDGNDRTDNRYDDQQYPDLCWSQAGQDEC